MNSWVEEIIGEGGAFARCCEGYEHRPEQLQMAAAVAEAMELYRHCLIEAGTGVGKTVAYLTPAIIHSLQGKPVIISTHTINLQEQLIKKDIPLMQSAMPDTPFKSVLVKGRGNYLCLWELDQARGDVTMAGDPLFERILKWAEETQTGDVSELDFTFPNWNEICSNQDTCRHQQCCHFEKCHYYGMRKRAAEADLIVVNHSLFFSDLGIRLMDPNNSILPEYGAVIFDEAHHLEDVASKVFGIEFSNYRVQNILNRIKKRRDIAVTATELDMIEDANKRLFALFQDVPRSEFFFQDAFQERQTNNLEEAATELMSLIDGLNRQLADQDVEEDEDLKHRIESFRRMLGRMKDELHSLFFREHDNYFKWCDKPNGGKFVSCCLHLTPVDVSSALEGSLWCRKDSVILTSATLANSGGFNYIRSRLGVPEDAIQMVLGSPFNYKEQSLLYVPKDLDFPSEKWTYAEAVSKRIEQLVTASGGRAFLLFTSYRMLNAVYDNLKGRLPYKLLKQGEKSNDKLLEEFRKSDDACLMGVHSFWEGVDVRGEKLSLVVIDKLPFAVPDSPINRARCDAITSSGGDWFREYAMPQAQIRLKQGFGRLIRTKTDRGVVAILDSRLIKKFYGKEFLRYLPKCKGTMKMEDVVEFYNHC
ncbi:MAG TPA: helicase C-terminal domain-containing protein [Armatimonadota bacterium]|nr:helicase C-terminal domain-containing protein [Armatimonadota bacterium]